MKVFPTISQEITLPLSPFTVPVHCHHKKGETAKTTQESNQYIEKKKEQREEQNIVPAGPTVMEVINKTHLFQD